MLYSVFYEVIHICSRNHGMKYILNFNDTFSFVGARGTRLGKYIEPQLEGQTNMPVGKAARHLSPVEKMEEGKT